MGIIRILSAVLALVFFVDAADAQDAVGDESRDGFTSYSELDVTEGSFFASTELYASLRGDWSRPGFLLHVYYGAGFYDYRNSDVRGGEVDVVPMSADLMIGYYGVIGETAYWNIMIGVGVENNDLDRNDRSNPVRGSEVGFKVAGEIESDDELRKFYYHLEGDYTTAFDTYWSRVRLGYGVGRMKVGPEGTFYGDETFNSQRIGAFLRFPVGLFQSLDPVIIFAGGYEFVHSDDSGPGDIDGFGSSGGSGDGAFGTASVELAF
jgi:hypothetical protein